MLDLGGGVGRHTIPAAQHFGKGSEVVCVDLLASAIEKLGQNAKQHGVAESVVGIQESNLTKLFNRGEQKTKNELALVLTS